MELNKTEQKMLQRTKCIIYWWNCRKKTLDINDTLDNVMKSKGIKITKVRRPESKLFNYTIKFNVGSENVVLKRIGNECSLIDFVVNALAYYLVYLGDKSQIETFGMYSRFKSINH